MLRNRALAVCSAALPLLALPARAQLALEQNLIGLSDKVTFDGHRLLSAGGGTLRIREWHAAGWALEDEILEPMPGIGFGISLGATAGFALVGAPGYDSQRGAVFVYQRQGQSWSLAQLIEAPNELGASDDFGEEIAARGERAAIAAPHAQPGRAFVYERVGDTWLERATLQAPPGSDNAEQLGTSVALVQDRIAAGAPYCCPDTAAGPGRVLVFRGAGASWQLTHELTPAGGGGGDQFGYAVAMNHDLLVVGSPNDIEGGVQAGSA